MFSEADLRAVNAICLRHGIYHICDEAYEHFTWDGAVHFSPASIAGSEGHTIGLYSFSKSYGFASWRIGYMVVPRQLFEPIRKIQDTNLICPPVISQWAAVGALEAGREYCRRQMPSMAAARRAVLEALQDASEVCSVPAAAGAFYLLLNVPTAMDSMRLVEWLVCEHRVAVMPGSTFRVTDRCALRLSYGPLRPETAEEGVGRLLDSRPARDPSGVNHAPGVLPTRHRMGSPTKALPPPRRPHHDLLDCLPIIGPIRNSGSEKRFKQAVATILTKGFRIGSGRRKVV